MRAGLACPRGWAAAGLSAPQPRTERRPFLRPRLQCAQGRAPRVPGGRRAGNRRRAGGQRGEGAAEDVTPSGTWRRERRGEGYGPGLCKGPEVVRPAGEGPLVACVQERFSVGRNLIKRPQLLVWTRRKAPPRPAQARSLLCFRYLRFRPPTPVRVFLSPLHTPRSLWARCPPGVGVGVLARSVAGCAAGAGARPAVGAEKGVRGVERRVGGIWVSQCKEGTLVCLPPCKTGSVPVCKWTE